jgi:hypothetical protein
MSSRRRDGGRAGFARLQREEANTCGIAINVRLSAKIPAPGCASMSGKPGAWP